MHSTTAVADPLCTVVPENAMLVQSSMAIEVPRPWYSISTGSAVFSTGSLSPVSAAWVTNRSLAVMMRTSAGIMSPAESFTMSPGTTSSMGISRPASPPRITQQVVVTMFLRALAALSLLDSCV